MATTLKKNRAAGRCLRFSIAIVATSSPAWAMMPPAPAARLYHLWTKGQRGPTRRYDGKAVFDDLSRWQPEGTHPIHDHIQLYSALLYSKHFERRLQVVLVVDTRHQKYVLLASSDEQQSASQIAHYYHLRFQIELVFRDAKQFTGLSQCQVRSDAKLDYHGTGHPAERHAERGKRGPAVAGC